MATAIDTTTLQPIMLVGNPIRFKVTTDNHVMPFYLLIAKLTITIGAVTKYATMSVEPDSSGVAWFDAAPFLYDYVVDSMKSHTTDLSTSTPLVGDPMVGYSISITEGYGIPYTEYATVLATSSTFYAIYGGLPDYYCQQLELRGSNFYDDIIQQNHFLTNQPTEKNVYENQPEQLRFFHTDELVAVCKVKYVDSAGNETTDTLCRLILNPNHIHTLLATREFCCTSTSLFYEVWVEDAYGNVIVQPQRYICVSNIPTNIRHVVFRNSLGSYDTATLTGRMVNELEFSAGSYLNNVVTNLRNAIVPEQARGFANRYLSGSIGWVTDDELEWITDMLHSDDRLLLMEDQSYEPIIISPDRYMVQSDTPGPKSLTIEAIVGAGNIFF